MTQLQHQGMPAVMQTCSALVVYRGCRLLVQVPDFKKFTSDCGPNENRPARNPYEVPVGKKFPMLNDSGSLAVKIGVVKRQAAGRVVRRWSLVLAVLAAAGLRLRWARR